MRCDHNSAAFHVLEAGLLTSIQDLGRAGLRHLGIPHGGAADRYSAALANICLGNSIHAPVIECTQGGLIIECHLSNDEKINIAVSGADMKVQLNDREITYSKSICVTHGDILKFGQATSGLRSYLAVTGGFAGDNFFQSQSTHFMAGTTSGFGGHQGRALRAGDRLVPSQNLHDAPSHLFLSSALYPQFTNEWVLRVTAGPDVQGLPQFDQQLIFENLLGQAFMITHESNRMGLRLKATKPFSQENMLKELTASAPVFPGTVQWPAGGMPILLGCDAQTTGGYGRALQVIATDLPLIGQMRAMDKVWFQKISNDEAREIVKQKTELVKLSASDFSFI